MAELLLLYYLKRLPCTIYVAVVLYVLMRLETMNIILGRFIYGDKFTIVTDCHDNSII